MKTKTLAFTLLSAAALLFGGTRALASGSDMVGRAANASESPRDTRTRPDRSLKIHVTPEPQFPLSLSEKTRTGHVRVLIEVDSEGKLTDYMLVAYSRKAFAKAVEDVIRQWTFEPAQYAGQGVGVVTEVNVDFDTGGVVINTDFQEIVDNFLHSWRNSIPEYAPANIRQIDRIPEPIKVINPQYHVGMGVAGEVMIQFYINEEGKVRMPHVAKADDLRLAELAMDAIRGWEFSPPTYKGRPVLVKASQVFRFSEKKPVQSKASAGTP